MKVKVKGRRKGEKINGKKHYHAKGITSISAYCPCAPEPLYFDENTFDYSLHFSTSDCAGNQHEAIEICKNCGQKWKVKIEDIPGGQAAYMFKVAEEENECG